MANKMKSHPSHIVLTVLSVLAILCHSCKAPQYIPIETTHNFHHTNNTRDSIFIRDSTIIIHTGDTIRTEYHHHHYHIQTFRDSIIKSDSIPYPVEVEKQVKSPLSQWQIFQLWSGRIFWLIVAIILIGKRKIPLRR